MRRVWSWLTVKKSDKNPYIKIPKDILKELKIRTPKSYYVILVETDEDLEGIVKCLRREVEVV